MSQLLSTVIICANLLNNKYWKIARCCALLVSPALFFSLVSLSYGWPSFVTRLLLLSVFLVVAGGVSKYIKCMGSIMCVNCGNAHANKPIYKAGRLIICCSNCGNSFNTDCIIDYAGAPPRCERPN